MSIVGSGASNYDWVSRLAVEAVQASRFAALDANLNLALHTAEKAVEAAQFLALRETVPHQAAIIQTLETENRQLLNNANVLVNLVQTLIDQVNGQARAFTYTYVAVAALALSVTIGLFCNNMIG